MGNDVLPPQSPELPAPPPGSNDYEGLIRTIGAVLNPLAQQQSEVQRQAIHADLEKFKLADARKERQAWRSFILALVVVLIVAGGIGAFLWAGQYQFALYALTFLAGAVTGAGGIKAFERTRQ